MTRTVARKNTALIMRSPSTYLKQKVARAARSTVQILRQGTVALGSYIVRAIQVAAYLNIFPRVIRFLTPRRHFRKIQYEYTDNVSYLPGLRDRIVQFLSPESTTRKRVLRWLNGQAPSLQHVTNLSDQWCDGIALCALIDAVAPGTCPRHDILRRENGVNNCRLALRLVQRNLGIKEPMTSEVMSDPDKIQERKMLYYILGIQNASRIPVEAPKTLLKSQENSEKLQVNIEKECIASGSGLVVAVVDKRARFNITTQIYKYKNLYVEITGPNREKVRRKITVVKGGRAGTSIGASGSQSSKDEPHPEDDVPPEPIPLDYQVVKPGTYQVSYIPRSLGNYQVAITWGGEHIKNSPFRVRSTTAKNIEQTTVRGVAKAVSFQDDVDSSEQDQQGGLSDSETSSTRSRRQSLVRQAHISNIRDSYESTNASPFSSMCSSAVSSMDHSVDISDVFLPGQGSGHHPFISRNGSSMSTASSRSGSILSRSSSIMYGTDRPVAVKTRRKVIRRIIKGAGGTEEVTYPNVRSCSTLSSSQRSSVTSNYSMSTSISMDDRSPKFSTSSCSSNNSVRPPRPQPTSPPLSARYADHMSKIIMGKALDEISKQIAINLNANRESKDLLQDAKEKSQSADTKRPRPAVNSQGTTSPTNSTVRGADSSTVQSTKHDEKNSSDLEQYIKHRDDFLIELNQTEAPIQFGHADKSVGDSTGVTSTDRASSRGRNRVYKKRKEDKATQCTVQDIKNATGWASRRSGHRSAQLNRKTEKQKDGDSAIGESDSSGNSPSENKDHDKSRHGRSGGGLDQGELSVRTVYPSIARDNNNRVGVNGNIAVLSSQAAGKTGTQSSVQGRQSTFDSGFSDENGAGHAARDGSGTAENRLKIDDLRLRRGTSAALPIGDAPSGQEASSNPVNNKQQRAGGSSAISANKVPIKSNVTDAKQISPLEQIPTASGSISESTNDPPRLASQSNDVSKPDAKSKDDKLVSIPGQQFLTVDAICPDGSTAATPGDSSVGNISTPERDDSDACIISNPCSNDGSNSGRPEFVEHPLKPDDCGATMAGVSLDTMLQTLENDPDYSTREFLRTYRPILGDDCGILAELQADLAAVAPPPPTMDNVDMSVRSGKPDGSATEPNKNGPRTKTPNRPASERCFASGLGLHNGTVGIKNNFQVRTISAGNGSLSVTIRGPRPHTVNETNVVYTGDDFYEIIYDVSLAGFYVISVKWADKHIPDSPFIVQVTF